MTEQELKDLQQRNSDRLILAKQSLGTKYLLHKDNQVKRLRRPKKNINKSKVY